MTRTGDVLGVTRAAKPYPRRQPTRANVPNRLVSGTPASPDFGGTGALWNLSFAPTAGGMVGRILDAQDLSTNTCITSEILVNNKYCYLFLDACTCTKCPSPAFLTTPLSQCQHCNARPVPLPALHPT
jgi:hypothetical protein